MQEGPFAQRHDLLLWTVALAVVAVDAMSKTWALEALSGEPWRLPGLALHVSLDTDSAPWLGAGAIAIMGAFDLFVLGVLAILARQIRTAPWAVAAGLAAGAAASDFIDRLARPPGLLQGALVHLDRDRMDGLVQPRRRRTHPRRGTRRGAELPAWPRRVMADQAIGCRRARASPAHRSGPADRAAPGLLLGAGR